MALNQWPVKIKKMGFSKHLTKQSNLKLAMLLTFEEKDGS